MQNKIIQASAFLTLLVGTFIFGLLGKQAEMGLCTLAAAIALALSNIDKMKRFKGAGFEAEMFEKQFEAMVAKEAEPETKPTPSTYTSIGYGLDESTRAVVIALGNSKYTWRTISGITQESNQNSVSVKQALNWLKINDLAVQAGKYKNSNWGLTEEGRRLYNSIKRSDSKI
jgi:predicted transcriptional regulator